MLSHPTKVDFLEQTVRAAELSGPKESFLEPQALAEVCNSLDSDCG